MDVFTPSPTPPLPVRRHPQLQLPPLPVSESTTGLVPAPLFIKRRRFPPRVLVTVQEIPQLSPTLSDSDSDPPSSPTASFHSSSSSVLSTPPSSAPNSPSRRPQALRQPFDVIAHWEPEWTPLPLSLPTPRRCLRRKPSPKKESLRTLRAKDSEACLQRAYEQRLEAYLSGDIFQRAKWRDDLGCIEE